jgi:hypothetical protein
MENVAELMFSALAWARRGGAPSGQRQKRGSCKVEGAVVVAITSFLGNPPAAQSALCLFCASTSAFAGGFSVGYNEAWFLNNYPTWLASNPTYYFTDRFCPNPPRNFSSRFDQTLSVIDSYFDGMKKGGANIVRIWVRGSRSSKTTEQNQQLRS